METYLQHLDKLNQLVETHQSTSIWSLIHQHVGVIFVVGLLLCIVSYIILSASYRVSRQDLSGGHFETMLFIGVFLVVGLAGIGDMIVYPIVTPQHEQLGITEESHTSIVNTIADMPEDDYNALIEGKKTYKLTEKQQDEYKVALKMLNIKRKSN